MTERVWNFFAPAQLAPKPIAPVVVATISKANAETMESVIKQGVNYRTSELVELSGLSKTTVCVWCRVYCTSIGSKNKGYTWRLR